MFSSLQTMMGRRIPVILMAMGFMALIGVSLGRTVGKAAIPVKKAAVPVKKSPAVRFPMVRSAAAENGACLADASATVTVRSLGAVELMSVDATGLPPNTDFDFFVLQIPNAPFGLAWYQGDVETDDNGEAHQEFLGRFNNETFIVAQPPGGQPAPVEHSNPPFPDASSNPATEPVHTYHLGLWFNSPDDAVAARCPGTVTRFNGEHNAGIQVLSTRNFPGLGPLHQIGN
jgi:hypothetical protein